MNHAASPELCAALDRTACAVNGMAVRPGCEPLARDLFCRIVAAVQLPTDPARLRSLTEDLTELMNVMEPQ